MKTGRKAVVPFLLILVLVIGWTQASGEPEGEAAFHLTSIVQVFPGTVAKPNAQYVVLQAYAAGQNLVAGHKVFFFNAAGIKVDSATFLASMANSANQAFILVSTPQAETLFNIAKNLAMPAAIDPAGGKICFDGTNIDCISWGNYSGSTVGVGTPFRKDFGLSRGRAAVRRLDISGSPTILDFADDTQDSKNDFREAGPVPHNNAGGVGVTPGSTCGDGIVSGLEQCDDAGTSSGDGCDATCQIEYCGDTVVQPGEACDDGNLTVGDGCDALCQLEPVCGNSIVEAGETCDDGNTNSGDGCDSVCQLEPVCGNSIVEAGETCDDGNTSSGDGCDSLCQIEPVCGNSIVEPGETCDDGNTSSGDGCDSVCHVEGCPVTSTGDVNVSGAITSADIIALVNFVFKGGPAPNPCAAAGDVNCSGQITSADIIYLVNSVFKAGIAPCNVCTLIPGTWSCP